MAGYSTSPSSLLTDPWLKCRSISTMPSASSGFMQVWMQPVAHPRLPPSGSLDFSSVITPRPASRPVMVAATPAAPYPTTTTSVSSSHASGIHQSFCSCAAADPHPTSPTAAVPTAASPAPFKKLRLLNCSIVPPSIRTAHAALTLSIVGSTRSRQSPRCGWNRHPFSSDLRAPTLTKRVVDAKIRVIPQG